LIFTTTLVREGRREEEGSENGIEMCSSSGWVSDIYSMGEEEEMRKRRKRRKRRRTLRMTRILILILVPHPDPRLHPLHHPPVHPCRLKTFGTP